MSSVTGSSSIASSLHPATSRLVRYSGNAADGTAVLTFGDGNASVLVSVANVGDSTWHFHDGASTLTDEATIRVVNDLVTNHQNRVKEAIDIGRAK